MRFELPLLLLGLSSAAQATWSLTYYSEADCKGTNLGHRDGKDNDKRIDCENFKEDKVKSVKAEWTNSKNKLQVFSYECGDKPAGDHIITAFHKSGQCADVTANLGADGGFHSFNYYYSSVSLIYEIR